MSRRQKRKARAAAAEKRANRYLTPIVSAAGQIEGYRFAPGPGLRAKGARSQILRYDTGGAMTLDDARTFRDAAVDRAAGGAPAPGARKAPARAVTLAELWAAYHDATAAAIAQNETLAPARRDEDVIKPGTLRFYRSTIKPWLKFAGDEPAAALDGELIEAEYKRQKATRSHHSAAASLAALQAVFAFGVKRRQVPANPTLNLGFAAPPGRLRLGSPAEMRALVDAADALAAAAATPERARLYRAVGDAIVAALWTGQREGDLLDCDLGRQLEREDDGTLFLVFARTHGADFSQAKTGGQAQVQVLPPLAERLGERRVGRLVPGRNGARWSAESFRDYFAAVRAEAAKQIPSVADFQFRDTRDTAITRLDDAEIPITKIALWSGHSLKTIDQILQEHYLVTTRAGAKAAATKFEAWRVRKDVKW